MSAMGPPTSGGALQSLAKASEECSKTLPDGWSTFDIQKLNSEIEELNKILSQLQIQKYFLTRFSELSVDRHWEHHEKTIGNILDIFQTTDGAKQKIRERKQRLRSLKPEALIFLAESFPTNVICSRPMDGGFEFLMKYVEGFVEKTLWARKWLFSDQVKELVREIRMESIQKGNPIEDEKAWYAFLKGYETFWKTRRQKWNLRGKPRDCDHRWSGKARVPQGKSEKAISCFCQSRKF